MRLVFKGLTNKPYNMFMYSVFRFPDASEVSVTSDAESFYTYDAEPEEYDIAEETLGVPVEELYRFELTWELCYCFNDDETNEEEYGDIVRYYTREDVKKFRTAEMVEICTHEDAVPDYFIAFDSFSVYW